MKDFMTQGEKEGEVLKSIGMKEIDPALMAPGSIVQVDEENEKGRRWLIWSIEHSGWWKPNRVGYTNERTSAGRYTFEEACKIVKDANLGLRTAPNEAMVRV